MQDQDEFEIIDTSQEGSSVVVSGAMSPTLSARTLRILSAADVNEVVKSLTPAELLSNQSSVFTSYTSSHTVDDSADVQVPLRTTVNLPDHRLLVMPARLAGPGLGTAIKLVSVPSQGAEGLPGTTVVMDEATGSVKAVVNARELTALRNAAGRF
jgi:ornithine cyclodeaminase/alanine dehydrogenase-like protein (mu-crystallin family)